MGAFKDIQTEAEEKASDPVFRLAVVLIMEDLLRNIFDKTADILAKNFAMRGELRNFVWKKNNHVS